MPVATNHYAVLLEHDDDASSFSQHIVFPIGSRQPVIYTRSVVEGTTTSWRISRDLPVDTYLTTGPIVVPVTSEDVEEWENDGLPSDLIRRMLDLLSKADPESVRLSDLEGGRMALDLIASGDPVVQSWMAPSSMVAEPVVDDVERPGAIVTLPTDPRQAYIPDPSVAEAYVHRTVWGVEDFTVLQWCIDNRKNALLVGGTGSGKTMLAEAFSAAYMRPTALISGNYALDSRQILGGLVGDGKGGWVWMDGVAIEVVRNGGTLILDELNFIPSKIATVLFPLLAGQRHITLLDHNGETVRAHPDLLIVATMNPAYAGTLELNAALRNRFTVQIKWGYDPAVGRQLIRSESLLMLAESLRKVEADGDISTPTPTNALMDFELLAKELGFEFASQNFLSRYEDYELDRVSHSLELSSEDIMADLGFDVPTYTEEIEDVTNPIQSLADLNITL